MAHHVKCRGQFERDLLLTKLSLAIGEEKIYQGSTNKDVEDLMSILQGIVTEYHDDGDQMGEACNCHIIHHVEAAGGTV